jgi:hypothetical protein
MSNPHFQKWRKWLDRIYQEQLQDLLINDHIFRQLNECIEPYIGATKGGELSRWMSQNYVAFAATAIRRLVEPPKTTWRSISLVILLSDVKANTHLVTRERRRRQYRRSNIPRKAATEFADEEFYELAGKSGVKVFPAQRIQRDIDVLKRKASKVKRLVDKVIAHTEEDRRKVPRVLFKDIDDAVIACRETYERYYLLLTARSFDASVLPCSFDVTDDLRKIWPVP